MSVIGIDFGNYKTCIAVARNRGIDIVVNEVSNRFTPSMVSFNGNQRFLGEGAKTQEVMNCKNTVTNLKRLVGRDFNESEVQDVEKKYLFFNLVESENGFTGAKVQYNGEQQIFDSTQLLAMFFTQLKHTAEVSLENSVSAAVISVPAYYTDRQRHAILSAAEISHLNCIRLINEPTAAALAYGITRVSDLPEKDPRNVVFIDVGHSAMTVSVASFTKEKAEVKATSFDRHVGGRVIDDIVVNHFIEKIKEKHKQDISTNPKTVLRLRVACEKLKHVLSANAQAALQIECLTDTLDISFVMKREEFEEITAHIYERITSPIRIALHDAGLKKEDVHFVEIIGGSTRIPAIQNKIAAFFERPELLMKTLNMDEAVARGCALQCAISSPLFKVREYQIKDVTAYGIKLAWDPTGEASTTTEGVLFKPADPVPATKAITFNRSKPFELRVEYSEKEKLPPGSSSFVGRYMINGVTPAADGGNSEIKIKARVNESGIFSIESADLMEEVAETVPSSPMETDKAPAAGPDATGDVNMAEGDAPKKKKIRKPLPVDSKSSSLAPEVLNKYRETEGQMIASDKLILETQEKKNSLESYIYEMRGKVEGSHAEFIDEKVKEDFLSKLNEIESWLYEEGETATKSIFVEKLSSLQKIGQPMEVRYREADERPSVVSELEKAIAQFKGLASSDDPKYEHIEAADKQKVLEECEKKEKWLRDSLETLAKQKKTEDPKVLVSQIKSNRETLVMFCAPIMNKPKPKPKEEPPKPAEQPAEQPKSEETPAAEPAKPKDEMDVD